MIVSLPALPVTFVMPLQLVPMPVLAPPPDPESPETLAAARFGVEASVLYRAPSVPAV